MAGDTLLSRLRVTTKKSKTFETSITSVAYSTGFLPLDYRNGYKLTSLNDEEEVISERDSVGLVGGSFITVVGKTGVAKTTLCLQMAANMVKPFKNGFVVINDLEQSLTLTRIKNITGLTQKEMKSKIILKQEKNYIEDIFEMIMAIVREKEANKDDYMYDTGLLDEYGDPITAYEPTIIINDSIPTMSCKETEKNDEMEGQTYANRVAKALAQFYKKLTPIIKAYNITVIAINHINQKIEINPFVKSQAQIAYLGQNESLPGGNAPLYYAHNILKLVAAGKYKEEDDGFDGLKVRVELIKARTNKSGQFTHLVLNQQSGFDPILSLLVYCEDNGLLEGRNPYKYFAGNPDVKFDSRKLKDEFLSRPEVRDAMMRVCVPSLQSILSVNDEKETEAKMTANELMDVISKIG